MIPPPAGAGFGPWLALLAAVGPHGAFRTCAPTPGGVAGVECRLAELDPLLARYDQPCAVVVSFLAGLVCAGLDPTQRWLDSRRAATGLAWLVAPPVWLTELALMAAAVRLDGWVGGRLAAAGLAGAWVGAALSRRCFGGGGGERAARRRQSAVDLEQYDVVRVGCEPPPARTVLGAADCYSH